MKLVASMVIRNERARYLFPCIRHLTRFCDEIRVLDDHSTDCLIGRYLDEISFGKAVVFRQQKPTFFEHEGETRQRLLEWTLEAEPTHILAIDADEFVTDGPCLRDCLEQGGDIWSLEMQEVWHATAGGLLLREDGGWRSHPITNVYRVPPPEHGRELRILDRALACGREPTYVRDAASHGQVESVGEILHFGWTNVAERQERYQRYVEHDSGRFHQGAHLESIMWGDERCALIGRGWPDTLAAYKANILCGAGIPPTEETP